MKREYRSIPSKSLGKPMEMLVYGESGKPFLVFPSQEGRFFDYENFGMIDILSPFIESGKIQVYCIDSIDHESWFAKISPADKARRANDYDWCVANEVVPHILADGHEGAGIIVHGCSFGGFHTANFFLKHPEHFDIGLSLSGCYSIDFTIEGFVNDDVYFNDPLKYAPNLTDKKKIAQLQENLLIVCSGQGAWEEWVGEAMQLCGSLKSNNIPVLLDLWGYDVEHDWPWWKKMIVYFLGKMDRAGFLSSNHRLNKKQSADFLKKFGTI